MSAVNLPYRIAIKQADGSIKYYRAKIKNSSGVVNSYRPYIKTPVTDAVAGTGKIGDRAQ
jgi:hypothetical protein